MTLTTGQEMLEDMLEDLLTTHCTPDHVRKAAVVGGGELWARLEELGLTLAALPEQAGGTGGDVLDDAAILLAAGRHAASLPLVETGFVGAWLLEPDDPACAAAVVFFNNAGYLGMCGHGAIGVAVTLAHLGRISPGEHSLQTPVGVVKIKLHSSNNVTI